ncbi:Uncharacterised protein [Mycobacteroides abscessus]|nr:Uncharacterised protein [Mycobacteroides abscessus]
MFFDMTTGWAFPMSDEPSDAQKLIAEVINAHPERRAMGCNGEDCGWLAGSHTPGPQTYPEHVAAEVDKALGGLTRETRTNSMSSGGYAVNSKTGERTQHSDYRYDSRWVSGWTVTE